MSYNQPPPPPPPPGYGAPPAPPPGYAPPGGYYYGPPGAPMPPSPQQSRSRSGPMLAIFIGALIGIGVLVGIIVLASQPPPPKPCPQDTFCPPDPRPTVPPDRTPGPGETVVPGTTLPPVETAAPTPAGQTPQPGQPSPTPASNAPPFVAGTVYRSTSLGYSFEYDSSADQWTLVKSEPAYAQLQLGPVELDVIGFSGDTSVDSALQTVYTQTDGFIIGRAKNTRDYDALLGPSIGYVAGSGGVFSGTWQNADGTPGDPVGITIMASTNGRATVVVIVFVTGPDRQFGNGTLDHAGRREVDKIIKTFLWEGG
jgi:hypothetical protein